MKIGFLGSEYFGVKNLENPAIPTSVHGGFGYLTRLKAEELVKMGYEVHVFIPAYAFAKESNEAKSIELNGVTIHLYKMAHSLQKFSLTNSIKLYFQESRGIRSLDVFLKEFPMDIYQSEEPTRASLQAAMYNNKQIVVFQDPFDNEDTRLLYEATREYTSIGLSSNSDQYKNRIARMVRDKLSAIVAENVYHREPTSRLLKILPKNQIYSEANFISEKVRKLYNLDYTPDYLPNPTDIPSSIPEKSPNPSILWLARWDPQKRVDVALKVASEMPHVDFYFVGTSTEYEPFTNVQIRLREEYRKFQNIHILDWINETKKLELLDRAWILLNTSCREGLPMSFLEGGAHGACIISSVDPDGYASMFGSHVQDNNFCSAIEQAVREEWHKTKGKQAYEYMKKVHSKETVMQKHIGIYRALQSAA